MRHAHRSASREIAHISSTGDEDSDDDDTPIVSGKAEFDDASSPDFIQRGPRGMTMSCFPTLAVLAILPIVIYIFDLPDA